MPRRRLQRRASLLGVVLLSGCARAITYRLPPSALVPRGPAPYRLLVDIFPDDRPTRERVPQPATAPPEGTRPDRVSSDRHFTRDIPRQIAERIAAHLSQSPLVRTARVEDGEEELERRPDQMRALAARGVDVVLTGRLAHFVGVDRGGHLIGRMPGFAGAPTAAVANPKAARGHAEYRDVKIIDVIHQRVLWQGTITRTIERPDAVFSGGPSASALEALREANEQLVELVQHALEDVSGSAHP